MKKKTLLSVLVLLVAVVLSSFAVATAEPTKGQTVEASISTAYRSYAGLTTLCTAAGLPSNPYPAPTVPETFTVPGNPQISQIREQSQYYIINALTIGDEAPKSGVACYVYDGVSNKDTGLTIHHFDATFYIGDLGDLESGFRGNLQMKLYGRVGTTFDYGTVHCVLQGFGDFSGQTLRLSQEPTTFASIMSNLTGYCNKE